MHFWRSFKKNLLLNSLNLAGNALAFCAMILLFSYLYQEYSFEQFHQNRERIYRPTYISAAPNFTAHWARIPVNYINQLPDEIPGIEKLIRFQNQEQKYLRVGDKRFKPLHAYVTDADVFEVFSFPLLAGDPSSALSKPQSVVLTESEALKLFGATEVLGREIMVSGDWSQEEKAYTVTGILQDVPENTHLPVSELFSFDSPQERNGWAYVYLLLSEHTTIQQIEAQMPDFVAKYASNEDGTVASFEFQPLKVIHLHSQLAREIVPNGSTIYLSIFWAVGLFIWLIVVVNFSNFNLALTLSRGKELGVRKILGANRRQLILQQFNTALLQTGISAFGALGLANLVTPFVQIMTGYFHLAPWLLLFLFLGAMVLLTAVIVSLMPMVIVRTFPVYPALRQGVLWTNLPKRRKLDVRKSLIIVQFSAATILVATTLITYRQFQYLRQTDLGLLPDQVIAIANVPDVVVQKYPIFRDRMKNVPGVLDVSACMQVPSEEIRDNGPVLLKGANQDPDQAPRMDIQIVDGEFLEMMGMEFLAGNDSLFRRSLSPYPTFSQELTPAHYLSGQKRSYIINATAMQQLGFNDPQDALGHEINFSIGGFELAYGPITGVIQDYHQESLRNRIDPLVMVVEPIWLQTFLVKFRPEQLDQIIGALKSTWVDLFPYPLEFHFLDDLFAQLYQQDRTQILLLSLLALLTLIISFMGSISLLMYSLGRREKELAIRRVIGARQGELYGMISREYVALLMGSMLLGIPVSWYGARMWLDQFAYRIAVRPETYLLVMGLLLFLLLTLIWLVSYRATRRNPVAFLREE